MFLGVLSYWEGSAQAGTPTPTPAPTPTPTDTPVVEPVIVVTSFPKLGRFSIAPSETPTALSDEDTLEVASLAAFIVRTFH